MHAFGSGKTAPNAGIASTAERCWSTPFPIAIPARTVSIGRRPANRRLDRWSPTGNRCEADGETRPSSHPGPGWTGFSCLGDDAAWHAGSSGGGRARSRRALGARHLWRWDATLSFWASRGYVVIEPEFRGSTGYGRAHLERLAPVGNDDAGRRRGRGPLGDEKGLIDRKRICIAGASYGGYATLMGPVRYPELYRCGVAWVAVTDPRLMFEASLAQRHPFARPGFTLAGPCSVIRQGRRDAEGLGPGQSVPAEIKVPMLIAFGGEDRRVPLEHGTACAPRCSARTSPSGSSTTTKGTAG